MNDALVIFNPTAGINAKYDVKAQVISELKALGFEPMVLMLDFYFETNIEREDLSGVKLVVAVGGDGTVKVAAREIITRKINAPVLIVPFGSANVLASSLKLPVNVKEALSLAKNLKTEKIDVGLLNKERYFIVGFSLGYVSSIIIHTEKDLKNKLGSLSYVIRLFWNKIRIPRIKFKIETQNRVFWVKGNSLIVFNAFNFYGFAPKKNVSIQDGVLNLYVITNKTFLAMAEAALGILFFDKPSRHIFTLDNQKFKIGVKRKSYLKTAQIDGDKIAVKNDMEIEVLPGALEVVVK